MHMVVLLTINWHTKSLASSTPKMWSGTHNVEMACVTLPTPTWGIVVITRQILQVQTHIHNLMSLVLSIPEIFQGCNILIWVMWPWPRPFEGWFIIGRWDLAGQHIWSTSDNLYTKFEVFRCTHCEGMKGGAKCRKLGGLGLLGVTQGHGYCHHPAERIRLLNRNYASILYRFQDTVSYLSQVADVNLSHLHLAPPLGMTLLEFCDL